MKSLLSMSEALRKLIMRRHYPREVMLTCVRWDVATSCPCWSLARSRQDLS